MKLVNLPSKHVPVDTWTRTIRGMGLIKVTVSYDTYGGYSRPKEG